MSSLLRYRRPNFDVATLCSILSRRSIRPVLLVGGFTVVLFVFMKVRELANLFYITGAFVRYHEWMTPVVGQQDVAVRQINTQEIGYSAVFLYLITSSQLRQLLLSLSYLHTNIPSPPWPILLFYTPDLDSPQLRTEFLLRLYDTLGGSTTAQTFISRIELIRIDWDLPKGMSKEKSKVDPVYIDKWPGYHLAQGFFATKIFEHPRIKEGNTTYFMRLEPDSYVFERLCFDPFEVMHKKGRKYGFVERGEDPGWVTHDMWAVTDRFVEGKPDVRERVEKNGWEWPDEKGLRIGKMNDENYQTYTGGFEVVRTDAFRTDEVGEWFEEVTSDYNLIYKYRWGAGAIRFATVNMFFDVEKDVEEFCGMSYFHNGVKSGRCRCKDQIRGLNL